MTVAVTNSYIAALGVVGSGAPATISFDPTVDAELLVVTVCWQSATTFVPPLVAFNNEVMTLNAPSVWDTDVGAIATFSVPLQSASVADVVIAPSGFLGNTQVCIIAYSGTGGQLGVQVIGEYGDSTAATNTGTTNFTGITTGSITTFVGATFFGGTPSSIVVSGTDWTSLGSASATNEGIYVAQNTDAGSLSVTYTDGGSNTWTMLVAGYEVLAGSPPAPGSGVTIEASALACLGVISSAVPASTTFDPTSDADFIVAAVGWASSDPFNMPSVLINGDLMQPVAAPYEIDNGFGAVALFVYNVPTPITEAATVTVNSAPNFLGHTSIALYSFSGSAQLLGGMFVGEIGTNSAGVLSGTVDMPSISVGSALCFVSCTFFGTPQPVLFRSAGWAYDGLETATDQTIEAFHSVVQSGGDQPITLSNTSTFFNSLCLGFEILLSGATAPASTVEITASGLFDMGPIGLDTITVDFDANGASLLIIALARTNNSALGPATTTYGGLPVSFLTSFEVVDNVTTTAMDIAFIANPPSGVQQLAATGYIGYIGYTEAYLVGLANTSGVVGVSSALNFDGGGLNMGMAPAVDGSLMLAFVSTIFPSADESPSYGWSTLASDDSDPSIRAWIFQSVGGPSSNLILSGSGFAGINAIALEFQAHISAMPDIVATGDTSLSHPVVVSEATNLGKLQPSGQDYHVYWESWLDIPLKDPALLQPDDFFLSRIPSYVTVVIISFAIPLMTYAQITDDLKATVGINFPGGGQLLRDTLNLLKFRNPNVKIYLAIQQNTPEIANNEPYSESGWGGMSADNVAAMFKFTQDFGISGIVIDYEVLSANDANHCTRHQDGTVTCYTDTELLATVKLMRAGLPRPIVLVLDGIHVGAYGSGNAYLNANPNGFNSGYDVCVANDPEALACLDAIHVMTYDAGSTYDPRTAIRAYQALFPTTPLYLGIRVGPLQFENVKQTADQIRDFCNSVIMLNMAGCHMYSGMWDVEYTGKNDPLNLTDAPFGNYSPVFPDASIAGQIVADVFNLGSENAPTPSGYTGQQKDLRMNNRPPAASIGVIGLKR